MTEHAHAALVRKGYEAFSRGDMDTLRGMMTADCAQHVPGDHQLSGDFKGIDAVLGYYGQLAGETNGSFRVELQKLFVDDRGHVVSVHRFTAERKGKKIDMAGGIIFRVVGDKITDLDECLEDLATADDFWA
ncbi:nuclear transport factor 2 family protein [Streptomyces sp. H10-C2]|uniref:nuclear transport factor 2 family protein n=1 Tax=unclassified Streptomyces TaxID=2593676 RepID=UPI0024BB7E14|nr:MULTISPECIES: nuclear transport factor 2 family protein [unclassified Streptomyces]MDJ0340000.1 nuclear transport factor 2 family protein [Streptomyces sp. PH10-H1]MDJ0369363.1 nuclear transport factor 2 family protein [Streptomyces sp. H10-C2]